MTLSYKFFIVFTGKEMSTFVQNNKILLEQLKKSDFIHCIKSVRLYTKKKKLPAMTSILKTIFTITCTEK